MMDATRVSFGVREVATMLGVSYRYVFYEIQEGRLKAARFGRRHLVSRADLVTWARAHGLELDDARTPRA